MATSPFSYVTYLKIPQLLWPITLCLLILPTSNLVQRQVLWSYRPCKNFGQINCNLHNHVFDDVVRKPPKGKNCSASWVSSDLSF